MGFMDDPLGRAQKGDSHLFEKVAGAGIFTFRTMTFKDVFMQNSPSLAYAVIIIKPR